MTSDILPAPLANELLIAEETMREAERLMNGVQHRIALWHCERGEHVFGMYEKPAIGRACIYCRHPG